jgi:MraZ protein
VAKSGLKWCKVVKNYILLHHFYKYLIMTIFIGDYTCKVDAKSRVMLPSAFKKQMPVAAQDKFVIKKDIYEKCLVLYPMDEWERQNQLIRQNINPYNKEHNQFLREFYKDTAEIELDTNNRFVIPARLLALVGTDKETEVIMAGQMGKIEIWPKDKYEQASEEIGDFGELANRILGGTINKQNE